MCVPAMATLAGSREDKEVPRTLSQDHEFFSQEQICYGRDPATRIVITIPGTFNDQRHPRAYSDWLAMSRRLVRSETSTPKMPLDPNTLRCSMVCSIVINAISSVSTIVSGQ